MFSEEQREARERQIFNYYNFYKYGETVLVLLCLSEVVLLVPQNIGVAAAILESVHINLGKIYSLAAEYGLEEWEVSTAITFSTILMTFIFNWRYSVYKEIIEDITNEKPANLN